MVLIALIWFIDCLYLLSGFGLCFVWVELAGDLVLIAFIFWVGMYDGYLFCVLVLTCGGVAAIA